MRTRVHDGDGIGKGVGSITQIEAANVTEYRGESYTANVTIQRGWLYLVLFTRGFLGKKVDWVANRGSSGTGCRQDVSTCSLGLRSPELSSSVQTRVK